MPRFRSAVLFAALALPLFAQPAAVKQSFDAFRADAIKAHDRFLSSDLLEGRGPGTRGDALAQSYIAAQFEAMGLAPAGDNGTFLQKVALLGITTDPAKTRVGFTNGMDALKYLDQYVGGNQTQNLTETLDSDVVFVGHGVVAPEYKWDDYKDVDMHGKTLVMLVDDPPANAQEPDLFKGRARTYYGRWTYKYEIGAARGADAVILIHTDEAAGYGWQVVRSSWSGEQDYVKNAAGQPALKLAAWVTLPVAQELFKRAGLDLAAMTKAAASRDFKPVSLKTKLQGTVVSAMRPFETANVIAKLEGTDLKNEAVLYTAHHDHLGIGPADADDPADTIYNGAIDNASGTATVLEIARVWSLAQPRPRRSVYFAAVAAEEQGLLGSKFLAGHLPVPAKDVALAINFDSVHMFGDVTSVTMNGVDKMTFFPTAQNVTKTLGLTIVPDQAPEQGSYYRSDHFSLAKVGVPAFSVSQGIDIAGKTPEWSRAKMKKYRDKHYHQPSDEFDPTWNFASAVQMARLGFWLGYEAANSDGKPEWVERP